MLRITWTDPGSNKKVSSKIGTKKHIHNQKITVAFPGTYHEESGHFTLQVHVEGKRIREFPT